MTIQRRRRGRLGSAGRSADDVDLGKFDFTDAPNPSYREWRVPAALINERATVTLMTDEEL